MGALGTNGTAKKAGASTATASAKEFDSVDSFVAGTHIPRFMPKELLNVGLCKSKEDLEKFRTSLGEFRKVVQWTQQKYKMQQTAADLALELSKSQNELISYFAKTVLKQAKSDSELAAMLGALPGMLGAIEGTVEKKKEEKVKTFTERLAKAGKGESTT
ncbi:MAG: hypothetical protein KME46_29795 [Brasilonema angustatum HA4187-MV1]|jgi:hypothetical protein|nr:hypothetical protein [Brasilonema angustatum HA4187-MV1]